MPGGFFEQTAIVPATARLSILIARTRPHLGSALAPAVTAILHLAVLRSPPGYEIRAAGSNLRAMALQGVNVERLVLVVSTPFAPGHATIAGLP